MTIKMTIKSFRVVIADLNSEFNEILEEKNDSMFFLRIARYGKYVSDNEVLMKIISPLYKESKKDIISFGEAWKQFYEEWKPLAKDLLEKAGKAGLKETHPLQNEIAELKRRLENATVSYDHDELYYFYRPYFELIQRFKDAGKEKLIADKHLEESGSKFTIELNKTEGEWEKFKSLREISVWWAHYKIELLACVVYSEAYKNAYFDSNRMLDAIYKYEIERLGKGHSYAPIYLKRFDYEKWVKRLHNYLIPRAESFIFYDQEMKNGDPVADLQRRSNPTLLPKRDLRKKIINVIKTGKFGKKEEAFLRFLSKDFGPKKIEEIAHEISTKNCKSIKCRVKKKLKGTGFSLEIIKANEWGGKSQYQLKYPTPPEII